MSLLMAVREAFAPILAEFVADRAKLGDYLAMIKPSQDGKLGDYQANFAMALAKIAGKKPPELARELIAKLPPSDLFEVPEIAGPGFINIRLKTDYLARALHDMTGERLGVPHVAPVKTYVIDYSGPNVAKPLHVGHLRSTIIGEALSRLLRFMGHNVISDNHLGDWGMQFGILLYGYKNMRDEAAYAANPVRELARLYIEVRKQFKKADDEDGPVVDDPVAGACREETAKLHAGDAENLNLWREFMPYCLEEIHACYDRLDVHFDTEHGESFYHPMLADVVDDLVAKKLAAESNGAMVIPNAKGIIPRTPEECEKEEPPSIVRSRHGAYTYTTSDLATIRFRAETYQPQAMLYVVDFRQDLHFRTLFAQAKRWGYDAIEMQHLKFGSVLGKDGKPFSTRGGGALELQDLLDEAVRMGAQKYQQTRQDRIDRGEEVPELTEGEIQNVAEVVGIGAVKYADLSQNRESNYVFDYEKMLATEGNTATYMQYAYVRNRGICRKGEIDVVSLRQTPPPILLGTPQERALALQLLRFDEALERAAADYLPHLLTAYLWDLCKSFNGFYAECKVLKAETEELKVSRLFLCDLTARVIQQALALLGIRTVETM